MAYLIDREQALWGGIVVAILNVRRRRVRSRVVLRDNSWYQTLTRPVAWRRKHAASISAWPAVHWQRSE